MKDVRSDFRRKLRRIGKKHRAMARGYEGRVRPDGLIVMTPKRTARGPSMRSVLLFLAAFIAFKGFLIASIGVESYGERVVKLQQGTVVEQAGAIVMQLDPVSEFLALKIGPVLP